MGVEVRFEARDDAVAVDDEMSDEEEEGTDVIAVFVNMYELAVFATQHLLMLTLGDYSMEVLEELRSVEAMKPDFMTLSTRDYLRCMRSLYLVLLLKELDMRVVDFQLVTPKAKQQEWN